ncbi:hypothetical protein [Clostridium sp. CF012]|uniref:hypothetical protein n=1 Tax=Clostridium sp. CF012 TaxID=2843319 RepID=UPI001C0DB9BF|nr:hypothetical protein [Clostridium sp. CF012]MBU3142316.1 hypothetical protein [Clostridium sp. CF012]
MSSSNGVSIQLEEIEKIINELEEINALCFEPHLKMKIGELQTFVSSILNSDSKISLENVIFEKMVEAKNLNPDLHLKLYMLYRNLTSGRISEMDAIASFESCIRMYPLDIIVF